MKIKLLTIILLAAIGLPAQNVTVSINSKTTFQTMDGFGYSQRYFSDPHLTGGNDRDTSAMPAGALVMTTDQQNELLDQLHTNLGLNRVRPMILGLIEPVNDNNDPNVTDLTLFNFDGLRNDAQIDYVQRAIPRGLTTYFISPVWLEPWMDDNTSATEYAEWVMAILRRWRSQGLEIPYWSIVNEPGYVRSGIWSGEWIRDAIKVLGPKMRLENFNTLIVTADDVRSTDAALRSTIILADTTARKYIGALATHLYDEPISSVSQMQALSTQYNLPLWMTEFSVGSMPTAGLNGTPFDWMLMTHDLIANYNVSAVDYLSGFLGSTDYNYITIQNSGPQYIGYTLTKSYFFMGQYTKFVKQGAKRIQAMSSDQSIKVTAYADQSKIIFVAINNANAPTTVQFNSADFMDSVKVTRTSQTENWATLPTITVNDTTFIATLSPKSVTTFIGESSITGIKSIVSNERIVSVFPNPFSSLTTLKTTGVFNDAALDVYNLYGQIVKQIKNISGQTITVQRDNLTAGIYFLRLTQNNKVITTHKLVITD